MEDLRRHPLAAIGKGWTSFFVLLGTGLFFAGDAVSAEKETAAQKPTRFDVLRTDDGAEYRNAKVIRVEPDSLVVQHDGGMARVPLFDLSAEIQAQFGFDPFKGMEHFKKETKEQRELRWRLFWEAERYRAEEAEKGAREDVIEAAKQSWIPVEAEVVKRMDEGVLARCRKIVFVPTKVRSSLGFLKDGPAERKLVDLSDGPVFLKFVLEGDGAGKGSRWEGYVSPSAWGFQSVGGKTPTVPVHKAVTRDTE